MAFGCPPSLGGSEVTHSSKSFTHLTCVVGLIFVRRAVYFFLQGSPLQFKVCAIFQLSIDLGAYRYLLVGAIINMKNLLSPAIVCQRVYYGAAIPPAVLQEEDDLEQALALAEE